MRFFWLTVPRQDGDSPEHGCVLAACAHSACSRVCADHFQHNAAVSTQYAAARLHIVCQLLVTAQEQEQDAAAQQHRQPQGQVSNEQSETVCLSVGLCVLDTRSHSQVCLFGGGSNSYQAAAPNTEEGGVSARQAINQLRNSPASFPPCNRKRRSRRTSWR